MGQQRSGAASVITSRAGEIHIVCSSGAFALPPKVGEIVEVLRDNSTTGIKMGRDYQISLEGFLYRIPAFRLRTFLNTEAELIDVPKER